MKLKLSSDDLAALRWMQWKNRSGEVKAHAIDPTSEARTGKLRTVTGSLIPTEAIPAEKDTPRDEFSLQLVAKAHEAWKAQRERAEKPAPEAKETKEAAKSTKRPPKAPKAAKEAKEPTEEAEAKTEPSAELKYEGAEAQIWLGEHLLAVFEKAKLNTKARHKIKLTDKTFKVYEGGKLVASGKLQK